MRILFTGGGSGGHFFPIIAIVRAIKDAAEEERILDTQFFYIGPKTEGEDALGREGVVVAHILAGKIRRHASLENIRDFFKTALGVLYAFWKLFI